MMQQSGEMTVHKKPTLPAPRRRIVCLLPLMALVSTPFAQAQDDYPSRAITMVVPSTPGGDTDTVGRLLAEGMSRALKQQVVVDPRPGAGGQIAMQLVAAARPDGYTISLTYQAAITLLPHLRKRPPYDPKRDFEAVGRVATTGNALLVAAGSPYKSLAELLARAKVEPGRLTFGSWGNGSGGHLNGEALKSAAGVDMVHVPYKGSPEEIVALISGELDMAFTGYGIAAAQSRAGKVRVLAVPATERSPLFPDAPTFREAGISFGMDGWFGIVAPRGTPPMVVQRLERALMEAARAPGLADRLAELGMKLAPTGAEQFARIIDADARTWGELAQKYGIEKN